MPWSPGTSSLFQSSSGGGQPMKPVRSARPGSELERRTFVPFACVNSYVRTLFERPSGQAAKTNLGGEVVSTGRGQVVEMSWKRATIGGDVVDWPGPPWHCAHARMNTALPCCSRAVRGGSGSGGGVL